MTGVKVNWRLSLMPFAPPSPFADHVYAVLGRSISGVSSKLSTSSRGMVCLAHKKAIRVTIFWSSASALGTSLMRSFATFWYDMLSSLKQPLIHVGDAVNLLSPSRRCAHFPSSMAIT
jgi:hypothetical protein